MASIVSVATHGTSTAVSAPVASAAMKKRVRLIDPATVAKHNTESSLWVVYNNRVYDVTEFAPDHPGGDELILQYAGKDMGEIMSDPSEHSHSDSAFELLEEHYIGQLAHTEEEKKLSSDALKDGNPAYILPANDGVVVDADFKPTDTDVSDDYKKYQFLDLNKPLILQVWYAKFDKAFYMKQVHSPRHLKEPARLFGPWYLEMFTRTPWYVVPLIWLPISMALFARSAYQFSQSAAVASAAAATAKALGTNSTMPTKLQHDFSPATLIFSQTAEASKALSSISAGSLALVFPCFVLGIFIWTVLEYTMHRFLFHIDDVLPDRPFFLMLHFLLHGIHHYLPMDRLRLVMPPLLFTLLQYPFTQLAHALFPAAVANGIISGAFFMYVGYDTMHYALHHTKLPEYVRKQKSWHMRHHFSDPDRFFGVTSRVWDFAFGTDQ